VRLADRGEVRRGQDGGARARNASRIAAPSPLLQRPPEPSFADGHSLSSALRRVAHRKKLRSEAPFPRTSVLPSQHAAGDRRFLAECPPVSQRAQRAQLHSEPARACKIRATDLTCTADDDAATEVPIGTLSAGPRRHRCHNRSHGACIVLYSEQGLIPTPKELSACQRRVERRSSRGHCCQSVPWHS
jgi:hypothetical protein